MSKRRKLVVGNWKMHGSHPANSDPVVAHPGRAAFGRPRGRVCAVPLSLANGGQPGR